MPKERAKEEAFSRKEVRDTQRLAKFQGQKPQQNKLNSKEVRKYGRFRPNDTEIRIVKRGVLSKIGLSKNVGKQLIDISEGGARVKTSDVIPKGTRIFLHLELPKFKDALEAQGEIRWVKEIRRETDYELGIMFTGIDEKDRNKIKFMQRYFDGKGHRD